MSAAKGTKSATKAAEPKVSRADYEAWQAEQERIKTAEATGSPELVALRKLARVAEHVFEADGIMHVHTLSPAEILGEALKCAQSDFAVLGDASSAGSGIVDSMVYRRAELRLDLALALAQYRSEFSSVEGGAS